MSLVHAKIGRKVQIDKDFHVADLANSKGSWFVCGHTGKKYLDCFSQFASMPLGWNHWRLLEYGGKYFLPEVVMHKIANSDMLSWAYADFCDYFDDWTKDFKHHFYICGGTLGVENALKAAFDYKAQKLGLNEEEVNTLDVIHFKGAFHGRSGYTLSLTNTDPAKYLRFPKFPWTRVEAPAIHFPEDDVVTQAAEARALYAIEMRLQRDDLVAAIIIEPIQGEGGDRHFTKLFMRALRYLADYFDCMLILDEVQTGMGLTGKTWCYQHLGIIPDMICFGKKSQVCGFACTEKIDQVPTNVFRVPSRINSTWGGNIVDMVRSTVYMRIIEEERLIENADITGKYLLDKLRTLEGPIQNIRGRGLMIAFDLPTHEERDALLARLKEKMLVMKCGERSIRLRPALTFTQQDADTAFDIVKWAVETK